MSAASPCWTCGAPPGDPVQCAGCEVLVGRCLCAASVQARRDLRRRDRCDACVDYDGRDVHGVRQISGLFLDGMPLAEIAATTGKTRGYVRRAIAAATHAGRRARRGAAA